MKFNRLTFSIFILITLFCGHISAAPKFFFVTPADGLYKIDVDTKQASRIDSELNTDYTTISKYGSDQLLVSDFSNKTIYVFNSDGTEDTSYQTNVYPISAIEYNDGSGDIVYNDYFNTDIRRINTDTRSDSVIYDDLPSDRLFWLVQRSDGDLCAFGYYGINGTIHAPTMTAIETNGDSPFLSVDTSDNIFRSGINYDRKTILKVDASNNVSTFWHDSNISIYNLFYSPVENNYYGLGSDSSSKINIYQFSVDGTLSIYLDNITGIGSSSISQSKLAVLYDSTETTIPEPYSLILLGLSLLSSVRRFFKINSVR